MHRLSPARTRLLLFSALLCTASLAACSDSTDERMIESSVAAPPRPIYIGTGQKVLLIGIDGATNRLIRPLMAKGQLPNFSRLVENGVIGPLTSEAPMSSPALWTTIATGEDRPTHGVQGFISDVIDSDGKPSIVTSLDRDVPALWNLVDRYGGKSHAIGWWATWPADPIHGVVVSDRLGHGRFDVWGAGTATTGLVHPESLTEDLIPLVVDPLTLSLDDLPPLAEWSEADHKAFDEAKVPIFGHNWSVLKFSYASQLTYERAAAAIKTKYEQPDLNAVFLIANDPISHTFWHYFEPKAFDGVDEDDAARLGQVIPNFYRYLDGAIGALLDGVDEDTIVMVVSDHGFEASGKLPMRLTAKEIKDQRLEAEQGGQVAVGQSGTHNPDGLVILSGGPIKKAIDLRASIYDVTPTVLALLGLPVSKTFAGKVLEEWVEPSFWEAHPIQWIDSIDPEFPRPKFVQPGAEEDAQSDMLEALGYIGHEDDE